MPSTSMPAALDRSFQGFFQEHRLVNIKWHLYLQLFKDAATTDLLNRFAALGFGMVQDVLLKDIVLCIARMMDETKAAWGEDANLATLIIDLAANEETDLAVKLRGIRDKIKPFSGEVERWREEQLSRNDSAAIVQRGCSVDAFPPVNREMIADILAAMGEIHGAVRAHYSGVERWHEEVPHAGDFDDLLSHLRELEGRKARDPG
jgi:hypothetical protein